MSEVNTQSFLSKAGVSGLVLGGICVAYFAINTFVGFLEPSGVFSVLVSLLSFALWGLKLFLCVYLMAKFMKEFLVENPGSTKSQLFGYGMVISVLSALLYCGAQLLYYDVINPDFFTTTVNEALQQANMASMLDMNSRMVLDSMMENLDKITFFSNLVYCIIFGVVLSAVLASRMVNNNPFNEEQ